MIPLFELKNIHCRKKSHSSGEWITIFEEANLSINGDGIFVVMGPSGSGKSTLLRFLNRLEDPDQGKIFFHGKPLNEMSILSLRQKIGILFQLPALPEKTVRENILFGPKVINHTLGEKDLREIMEHVDLGPSLLDREVKNLSVGQQQRASLARVLANRPEVLLLDEPTASLDPESTMKVENTIKRLVAEDGLHAIWVTHNPEQGKRLGKNLARIEGGRLFLCETLAI